MFFSHKLASTQLEELKKSAQYLTHNARYATFSRIGLDKRQYSLMTYCRTVDQISRAGLLSTQSNDCSFSAKCPFCLLELDFDPSDDPWANHTSLSSNCDFVTIGKLNEKDWTPQEAVKLALRLATTKMYEEMLELIGILDTIPAENPLSVESTKKLLELREGSKYLTYEQRLATLKGFAYDKQKLACTSKTLARAGFHRTNHEDSSTSAKCSFCLLELEFDETDDPFKEHKTHRADCDFVRHGQPDDSKWSMNEALKLAVRSAVMQKHEKGLWLIEEHENKNQELELKKQMQKLMEAPKSQSRRQSRV
ncbi:unnamed protein product [Caenorhabditis sp. 36 PRJEB53466]|nr:unnamed protein product [Caenorhabditis sp. 36 PRJEB53466]